MAAPPRPLFPPSRREGAGWGPSKAGKALSGLIVLYGDVETALDLRSTGQGAGEMCRGKFHRPAQAICAIVEPSKGVAGAPSFPVDFVRCVSWVHS
jgi:hypothetical protein